MEFTQFVDGIQRIIRDDMIAVVVTLILVAIQLVIFLRVRSRTSVPLKRARRRLEEFASDVKHGRFEERGQKHLGSNPELADAWASAYSREGTSVPDADSVDPSIAFEPSNLLPSGYNGRLDAAAPGLFTAIGIVGTFVGLILGFLRVNPAEANTSIAPLLGGMVVAFLNSLLGVALSIWWSYGSRSRRHDFDSACNAVRRAAKSRIATIGPGEQMLSVLTSIADKSQRMHDRNAAGFAVLAEHLISLQASTERASAQLLDNLSSKLGDSLQAMVSMPFDRLNDSVIRFDDIVRQTADRQEEIKTRLDVAASVLSEAEGKLAAGIALAKECVEEFTLATLQLREGATAAEGLVDRTQAAAAVIGKSADEVQRAASRYDEVATSLVSANEALSAATTAMTSTAATFGSSTLHLEAAVKTLKEASDETVGQSVVAVRKELETAIHSLVTGLDGSTSQTIRAYEQTSQRVVSVVDEKMSDLTDRLSAELTTLAARLPAEVESLNQSMIQIRIQIQKATRSMDESVSQLAHRTPEALAAQLDQFDKALSTAMDHFSGTLHQWDGKLGALESLAAEMRRIKLPGDSAMSPASALPA
jgi:ABC-type transporter Mla subunit MlaD